MTAAVQTAITVLLACPGCYKGGGATAWTYSMVTLFMLFVPFAMIGALVWLLRKSAADSEG